MVFSLLLKCTRNWATMGVIHYFEILFRRVAASSNNRINVGLAKAAPLRYAPSASRLCGAFALVTKHRNPHTKAIIIREQ
jgi:hypothetical protein